VPGQEATTGDNVTMRVDAVVCRQVIDPLKAIINVQNCQFAVSQVAQTSLRSVIGQSDIDQLLSEREKVNAHLKDVIDAPTEQPWGVCVERAEGKDVALPESMKRSMPRQGEAERERRADHRRRRGIPGIQEARPGRHGHGRRPGRIATAAAADCRRGRRRENSTLVMPAPAESLRFFDRAAPPQPGRPHRPLCRPRRPCPIYPPSRRQPAPP
jgi:regulator of protease activity HflC (stomatin/prohibitin superfamily)